MNLVNKSFTKTRHRNVFETPYYNDSYFKESLNGAYYLHFVYFSYVLVNKCYFKDYAIKL